MTGLIAIPCRPDQARHVAFFESLLALEKPADTVVRLYPGFFPHVNRARAVDDAMAGGAEWIFFVDDDQLFQPDALLKLLADHVDIVTCNLLLKERPWPPYLFQQGPDGVVPITLNTQQDLFTVAACGLGGVLVRRGVFDRIRKPWFDVNVEFRTDDLWFCALAREAGIPIHCDPRVLSGHCIRGAVWPHWDGVQWETAIDVHRGGAFFVPAARPSDEFQAWLDSQLVREG